jgi:putative ABC transport system permease protein
MKGALGMLGLSARLVMRDWRAGELRVLVAALVIAIAAVTSVGFFSDRVRLALIEQANALLGADLIVVSDRAIEPALRQEADRLGLAQAPVLRFPSMVIRGDRAQLSEVRAVGDGYPVKGDIGVAPRHLEVPVATRGVPARGTVWVDTRMVALLGVDGGDTIELGDRSFTIAGVFERDAEASVGFLSMSPRILVNALDLPETGLVQASSRISHRLMLAGPPGDIARYRGFVAQRLGAGQRVEDVREARPELRSAIERAERFLGLAALVSVILAGVAVALAARRFLQRHLDACAMMRCLGAPQRQMIGLYLTQFLLLGVVASAIGCAIGAAGQQVLVQVLGSLVSASLPAPTPWPAVKGMATGVVLLLGFGLPPLIALSTVPTLRVLRRDLGSPGRGSLLSWLAAVAAISAMVMWEAADLKLGLAMLGGTVATVAVCAGCAWLAMRGAGRLAGGGRGRGSFTWRYGIANLNRRALGSIVQMTALGLGIMALLLLTLVRGELLDNWRRSLPADTPNQFLVNIQPDQVERVRAFHAQEGLAAPNVQPMVRGRLVSVNGKPVQPSDYADDRTRRLVDREFNMSFMADVPPGNDLVAGRWWTPADKGSALMSFEQDIAARIGIRLGDSVVYDVAGTRREFIVTSLRRVDWDSFRTNFFVVTAPGALDGLPVSYITAFRLPEGREGFTNSLIREFPNLLVLDVGSILARVQAMIDQVSRAVEFLFLFTLLAGLVVLYAAIASTRDERVFEGAIIRTLGGSRRQLQVVQLAEFTAIGALSGLVAAFGASALAWALGRFVLGVPFVFDPWVWLAGFAGGALLVGAAGWVGTLGTLNAPPLATLRRV